MKLLTVNFLTCAAKSCRSSPLSFPLHFKDAIVHRTEMAYNPLLLTNILPRLNWEALRTTATELGLDAALPAENPSEQKGWEGDKVVEVEQGGTMEVDSSGTAAAAAPGAGDQDGGGDAVVPVGVTDEETKEQVLKKLHGLLLETSVLEGKLVCGNCGFEYPIKDGVGNFLLPAHLV
jgi:multifunctional methyltransferase subunit TRM112